LQLSDRESQLEKLRLEKGSKNDLSFHEIEKSHQKIRKELSLPPIANPQQIMGKNGSSKSLLPSVKNSRNLEYEYASLSILTPAKSLHNNNRSSLFN